MERIVGYAVGVLPIPQRPRVPGPERASVACVLTQPATRNVRALRQADRATSLVAVEVLGHSTPRVNCRLHNLIEQMFNQMERGTPRGGSGGESKQCAPPGHRYPVGYHREMAENTLIERARRGSGLSQRELARRSGTSQSTLSTYESGAKSPTLAVLERIVKTSGHALALTPRIEFATHAGSRGEPYVVPDRLWRLDLDDAFADVRLPGHLYWSGPSRVYRLSDRLDRARVYEIVLREGAEADLLTYVDGALLVDLWDDLVLPSSLRVAWAPLMSRFLGPSA